MEIQSAAPAMYALMIGPATDGSAHSMISRASLARYGSKLTAGGKPASVLALIVDGETAHERAASLRTLADVIGMAEAHRSPAPCGALLAVDHGGAS